MFPSLKNSGNFFLEVLIRLTGVFTTLVILSISIFLFREGAPLLGKKKMEENFAIAVHPNKDILSLSNQQLRDINSKQITNWNQIGGNDEIIEVLSLDNLEEKIPNVVFDEDQSKSEKAIYEFILKNENTIAIFPKKMLDYHLPRFRTENVSLLEILISKEWLPNSYPFPDFGARAIILGSLYVSLLTIFFAFPIGLAIALYQAEIASNSWRIIFRPVIDLLSGIPSVIFGLVGLVVIVPFVKESFNLTRGETALSGALVLSLISLPTVIQLSEDAIRRVSPDLKSSSYALGANQLQTMIFVSLPAAKSAIISAMVLTLGRVFGETMAVLMVTGNSNIIPGSPFNSVKTITGTIASELGETSFGSSHYQSLFVLGAILFVVTFFFNVIAVLIYPKSRYVN